MTTASSESVAADGVRVAAPLSPTAQVSLTTPGAVYVQNFDTLANTGLSAALPDGFYLSETGTGANTTYAASNGAANSGNTYSFGADGSVERAFGTLLSSSTVPTIGAAFTNNTGGVITSLTIAYTGEQWRLGAANRADRLDFQYSTNATSISTGDFIDVDALDFASVVATGALGPLDGNAAANRASISGTINGLSIAPGQTFYIRWTDLNAAGADDGLAIDDFSLSAVAGPVLPTLSIADVTQAEGTGGTTVYTFTVTLDAPAPSGGVVFDIATADGTATASSGDYVAKALTGQTIAEGATSYSFDVVVNADADFEPDQAFAVNVTNVAGAVVADGQAVGSITNDDAPGAPVISLTPTNISQAEGAGGAVTVYEYTVSRTGGTTGDATVAFTVSGSGADAAEAADFDGGAFPTGVVTIPDGQSSATFQVRVVNDDRLEGDEGFTVTLSQPVNVELGENSTATGVIANDDVVRIFDIQGAGHFSPLLGQTVTTRGVVVAVDASGRENGGNNPVGYWIQDQTGDGDYRTSDGVFVFLGTGSSATIPAGIQVGALVEVTATVSEFAATNQLSSTQLNNSSFTVINPAVDLPAAVRIGDVDDLATGLQRRPALVDLGDDDGDRTPDAPSVYDPVNQGADFWESLEGMRVVLEDVRVVSPFRSALGEQFATPNVGANPSGNSRGGLTISDATPGVVQPADKQFDFNPERIQLDNEAGVNTPTGLGVGDRLGDVTGVVNYASGQWEVHATEAYGPVTPANLERERTDIGENLDRIRVATFNVENLAPVGQTVDGAPTPQSKFTGLAQAVVTNLGSPEIIALQEVLDNDGAANTSVVSASTTLSQLIDAIVARGGPRYVAIDSPPNDDSAGGIPGGNQRVAYLYNPEAVTPTARNGLTTVVTDEDGVKVQLFPTSGQIGQGSSDFAGTRRSLPIEWAPAGFTDAAGGTFTTVNNHFSSKGGSAPLYGTLLDLPLYTDPLNGDAQAVTAENEREGQAELVNAYIDGLLTDGRSFNDRVVALGDFNDFQFFPVIDLVTGQLVRTAVGPDGAPSTFAPGTAVLSELMEKLPLSERYSYNFDGNFQALDQILVSNALFADAEFDIVHINSEFSEQLSDHDPSVASLLLPRSLALATAGADVLDQAAFTARFGAVRGSLAGNDRIEGGAGDDVLDGGLGADRLDGGDGLDTASYRSSAVGVVADLRNGSASDGDSLISIENLDGSGANDTFTGDAGDNRLTGDDGNDSLDGGAGNDTLNGNLGDDFVQGGAGADTVVGGQGNDRVFGGEDDDRLVGSLGDDVLNGGAGNDALDGAGGIDTASYADAASGVTVTLGVAGPQATGGAGSDSLFAIENLEGSAFADTLTGDSGANTLFGGDGGDTVNGGAGNDVINGNFGDDVINGNVGDDVIFGGQGNDRLVGGQGNDQLTGSLGDDILLGSLGADTLNGAGGADVFLYNAVNHSTTSERDVVLGFETGIDKVDLRAIYNSATDSFAITTSGGFTLLSVDLGSNGSIDTQIAFAGNATVTGGDLLLA